MNEFNIAQLAQCDGVADNCGTCNHPDLGLGIPEKGINIGPEREGRRRFWCEASETEVCLPMLY